MPDPLVEKIAVAGGLIQTDIILLIKSLPRQAFSFCKRAVAPAGSHVDILHQRDKLDVGLQTPGKADTKIRLSAGDGLDNISGAAVDQFYAHAGVTGLKAADNIRHKVTRQIDSAARRKLPYSSKARKA